MLDQSVKQWRDYAKDTTIWNIEKGFDLSIDDMIKAEVIRTNIYSKMLNSKNFHYFFILHLYQTYIDCPYPNCNTIVPGGF